jgi:hypothetical protein
VAKVRERLAVNKQRSQFSMERFSLKELKEIIAQIIQRVLYSIQTYQIIVKYTCFRIQYKPAKLPTLHNISVLTQLAFKLLA